MRDQSAYTLGRLAALEAQYPCIGEVRGVGLMLGFEVVDPCSERPDPELALQIQRGALERGLILELGGRQDCVVRLLPPLNVTRETLDQALEILESTLASVATPAAAQLAVPR